MLPVLLFAISLITSSCCSVLKVNQSEASWRQLRSEPKFAIFKTDIKKKLAENNIKDVKQVELFLDGSKMPDSEFKVQYKLKDDRPWVGMENKKTYDDIEMTYDMDDDEIEMDGEIGDAAFTITYRFKSPSKSVYDFPTPKIESPANAIISVPKGIMIMNGESLADSNEEDSSDSS